jgi:hypothetical protein
VDEDSSELATRAEKCLHVLLHIKEVTTNKSSMLAIKQEQQSNKFGSIQESEFSAVVEQTQTKLFEVCESLLTTTSSLYEELELNLGLSKLHGFLVLLKNIESSSLFFHSETYLGKLIDALLSVVSLEENVLIGDNILRDYTNFDFVFKPELYLSLKRPQKAFKYLTSEALKTRVVNIAEILSKSANVNLILDHLSKHLRSEYDSVDTNQTTGENFRKEAIYLLNEIMKGIKHENNDNELKRNISELLDTVVEIYLKLDRTKDTSSNKKSEIVQSNAKAKHVIDTEKNVDWTERCLAVEGLGILALVAQRSFLGEQFKSDHLGEILVFILTETNLNKSHSAHILYHTLLDLASAYNSQDIASMLKDNLDYLCRELAILLRKYLSASSRNKQHGTRRPEGLPTLLKAVLKLQDIKCEKVVELPELRDTIEALLHQLDLSWIDPDRSVTTEILQIINVFTNAFAESSSANKITTNKKSCNSEPQKGVLTQLVKDLQASDEIEQKYLEDQMEESHCPDSGFHSDIKDETASYEEDNATIKVVSDKIKFLRQTVEHTRHFISMVACPQWQILSLGIAIQKY